MKCTSGPVSFTESHVHARGKKIHVQDAFVLPKVTTNMLASPVDSIRQWKHLTGLDLADPEFGTFARIDVLLGADHYGEILLRNWQWSPRGTPYAQRMCSGWVLAEPLQPKDPRPVENELSRKFWEIGDYSMKQPVPSSEESTMVQHYESLHSRNSQSRFVVLRKSGVQACGNPGLRKDLMDSSDR